MPLFPYTLARPLLFGLDPETAHDLTLQALRHSQGTPLQWAYCEPRIDDPVQLAGLRFPNRVGLAAGLDKNAACIDALAAMGFGFIEVGTVTPRPQAGNPRPRMFRLPQAQALINRMGFNNDGLDAFLANVQRSALMQSRTRGAHATPAPLLGLNVGKNADTPMDRAVEDYLTGLAGVYPYADYIAINISSPNTRNLRDLQSDQALDALLGALTEQRKRLSDAHGLRRPMFLKIAPDLDIDQVRAITLALQRHGMDGVIATNTTLSRDAVQGQPHAQEAGGLSGAPVRQASNRVIASLRAELGPDFPIIGVGGILEAADALAKLQAGADVVQIYTGLIYQGPALVRQSAELIKNRLQAPSRKG